MKTKVIIYIIVSCICFNCNDSSNEQSQIYYMDFYASTIRSISCNDLQKSSKIQKVLLSDQEAEKLCFLIFNLPLAERDYISMDARAYGIVYDNIGNKKSFCMSLTLIEIDNKKYFVSEELRDYILELTKETMMSSKKKNDNFPSFFQ